MLKHVIKTDKLLFSYCEDNGVYTARITNFGPRIQIWTRIIETIGNNTALSQRSDILIAIQVITYVIY